MSEITELDLDRVLAHIIELAQDEEASAARRLNMIRVQIEKLWPPELPLIP
jgi:hypothetical protein